MTGGIFWFALAASAGAQFKPGDAVKATDCTDADNRLRISHDTSAGSTQGESA